MNTSLGQTLNIQTGAIWHQSALIPLKHISHMRYSRKYAWGEYFYQVALKSFKFVVLLALVYAALNTSIAESLFNSKEYIASFKKGFEAGLDEDLRGRLNEVDVLLITFLLSLISNLLEMKNPFAIYITSTSSDIITVEYSGSKEEVSKLYSDILEKLRNSPPQR